MSNIGLALSKVQQVIPRAVLEAAFREPYSARMRRTVTMDEYLRTNVIDARVRIDCDLVGGEMLYISLTGCPILYQGLNEAVIQIPKERSQGKTITTPLLVSLFNSAQMPASSIPAMSTSSWGSSGGSGYNVSLEAAKNVVAAYAPSMTISTNSIVLLSENVIQIRDINFIPQQMMLVAIAANDPELSNIPPSALPAFFKLVELATKMIIYNRINIDLGEAPIRGGHDSPRLREVVDRYADAAEMYDDYLENTWKLVALFADKNRKMEHLSTLLRRH